VKNKLLDITLIKVIFIYCIFRGMAQGHTLYYPFNTKVKIVQQVSKFMKIATHSFTLQYLL